jgi:hypothetical protein
VEREQRQAPGEQADAALAVAVADADEAERRAREKRQYVRARRSRYSGDQSASMRSAGSTTSADWTERTAPVSASIVVESSASRSTRIQSGIRALTARRTAT